ncbi:MAG: hypothetical protein QOK11_630 [Pseudonocardiales bacterium]|jgi:uncharacterized protein (DUF2267 family)|nr:hypothetical protein [Pseudonocardiales bacterium]
MDYEQFIKTVQDVLGMDRDGAERATQATLRTLADRLSTDQARHLVELLPPELGPALFHFGPPARLDVDAFLQRVSEREGVDLPIARRHAALVLAAFARAIGPDEFDRIAATFPKDFTPLLPRGPDIEPPPFEAIVTKVAQRAGLDHEGARASVDAVLLTLAEHIAPGEIDDLIARLPVELHPLLKEARARHSGRASHPSLDEFVERVAQREGIDAAEAAGHARAVLTTLREAVGDDEFFDVTVQLPPEFGALWAAQ